MKTTLCLGSCALITIFLLAAPAAADLSGYGIQITATNSDGTTGTFSVPTSSSIDEGYGSFDAGQPIMSADSQIVGYINSLDVSYDDSDPLVNLSFSVTAGSSTTTFALNSAIVSFLPLRNPNGFALVSGTLTDQGSGNITITGLFPGGNIYEADYNPLASSVDWADLVPTTTVSITGGFSGRQPATGSEVISATLSSIQSHFDFTLTANDSASASSQFNISGGTPVPEPSTIVLLGIGLAGLVLAKVRSLRNSKAASV